MPEPSAVQERIASVQERIAKLFSTKLNVDVPSVDTDLFEAGVLDSLAFVELLVDLEQKFGVKVSIDDVEIERFRSIEKIADFVVSLNGVKPGGSAAAEAQEAIHGPRPSAR